MMKVDTRDPDTLIVTTHRHGGVAMVRGKYRCTRCGHRLIVNGKLPRSTRSHPPWTWHRELIDRRKARSQHVSQDGVALAGPTG